MEQIPGWHISSPQLLEKVQTRRRLGNHGVDVFRPLKVTGDVDTQQLEYWYSFNCWTAKRQEWWWIFHYRADQHLIDLESIVFTFIRISSVLTLPMLVCKNNLTKLLNALLTCSFLLFTLNAMYKTFLDAKRFAITYVLIPTVYRNVLLDIWSTDYYRQHSFILYTCL